MSNTNVVRTAIASLMQTGQYIGTSVPKLPNSTLNQKLDIHQDIELAAGDVPSVRYLAIGNGGHGFIVGANGHVKWKAVHHKARHTALYNQLPFVLRRLDEDLSPTERLRYRLRRIETHNGVQYAAYYLRVLDISTTDVLAELRHVEDGVTTSTPWTPTLEDLNPMPPTLVAGEAVTTTGDYIASTAKIPFLMSADDVAEFVNAVKIIEGDDGYAVISEVATVSGVDRSVVGNIGGANQAYTDVIYAQVTSFISTAWVMEYQTDGVALTIDVGNVEALLDVSVAGI